MLEISGFHGLVAFIGDFQLSIAGASIPPPKKSSDGLSTSPLILLMVIIYAYFSLFSLSVSGSMQT